MDFLDGDALPPETEFTKTQRSGRVHSTRVILSVPVPEAEPVPEIEAGIDSASHYPHPLKVADPFLSDLCDKLMPCWEEQRITVKYGKKGSEPSHLEQVSISLSTDLNLEPIDLVVGSAEALLLKIRYYLLAQWRAAASATEVSDSTPSTNYLDVLGSFPKIGSSVDLLNEIQVELVSPSESEPDGLESSRYIELASTLRRLLHRNRSGKGLITLDPTQRPYPTAIVAPDSYETEWKAVCDIMFERVKYLEEILASVVEDVKAVLSGHPADWVAAFAQPFEKQGLAFRLGRLGLARALSVLPDDPPETDITSPEKLGSLPLECC
jgi:hypothetical protein